MQNREGNENGIKINRSNQQRNKLHVQHTFFLISKNTNLHMQHAFWLSLPLFCTTTMLFCRTKTSNFLVTHYFYGEIVLCAYPIFCLLCSCMFAFIFHCQSFSPCWPLAFLILTACFPSYKICLFCFQSLALALSLLST